MKKITAILLFTGLAFACRYNTAAPEAELREKLKQTMTDFLYKGIKNDSSVVKFNVLEVTYFENPTNYACEFKVRMRERNLDTTGLMSASISKDMTRVVRGY